MKRLIAIGLIGMAALSWDAPFAFGWGSVATGDIWPARFNTHACIDRFAYDFLQQDPALHTTSFPTLDEITAHEGITFGLTGPGPDAEGSSRYSEHYYNPRTGAGSAPTSVAKHFKTLAGKGTDSPKAAAWGAHFLADLSVPYHVNGMPATEVATAMASNPARLDLSGNVTGDRSLLSRPVASFLSVHDTNFKLEAQRFLATYDGHPFYDWFDPWYWNGSTDIKPYATSSHIAWEGLEAPECPSNPVTQYSALWPGNPRPSFDDPIGAMSAVVTEFAQANARNTVEGTSVVLHRGGVGELQAAESVATMWRASFSALRPSASFTYEPASAGEAGEAESTPPVAIVRAKVGNFAHETAQQVQVRLRVIGGLCRLAEGEDVEQTLGEAPPGVVSFGEWKVEIPHGSCRVAVEVIGRFTQTPDLEFAWRNVTIGEAPTTTAPPAPTGQCDPMECGCRKGDLSCVISCTTWKTQSCMIHPKDCPGPAPPPSPGCPRPDAETLHRSFWGR